MRNPCLRLVLLSALLLMVLSATACHAVIYVWKDAPGPTQDGNSWATAYRYIGNARNDSGATTEEMWVAGGTYNEMLSLQPLMKLYGGFSGTETYKEQRDWNANPTMIDPQGGTFAVYVGQPAVPGQDAVLDGFTITGASTCGVMVVGVNCRIRNCRITGNGTSWAAYGISANSAAYLTIAGCIITGNTGAGISLKDCTSAYLTHNTIVGDNGAGVETENSSTWIVDNILAFNGTGIRLITGTAPQGSSNCVYGNTTNYSGIAPGVRDVSTDPRLKDREHGDYHILAGSPCIDTGAGQQEIYNDMDGASRNQDGDGNGIPLFDIGAYEYPLDILNAKANRADNSNVGMGLCSVTAAFPSLGCIYVERPDRSAGIRVNIQSTYAPGDRLNVSGAIKTDATSGERYIEMSPTAYTKVGGRFLPEPPGMVNRDLVGKPLGLQGGIADAAGLNTIGLRVRIFGKVTHADTDFYYIDDGSKTDDGSGHAGVKVLALGTPVPAENSYTSVDGIVSCFKDGSSIRRQMLAGGELIVKPDFLAMAGPTPTMVAYIPGVSLAWNDVSPIPAINRIEYHIWRDGFPYPIVSSTPANAWSYLTPLGTFNHGLGDTLTARQVTFWYKTGDYRLKDFRTIEAQGHVPGATSRYWITCFCDTGNGYQESTPVYMGRATYVPEPSQVSPGVVGGVEDVDLSNITFAWKGSKGADQYRIEVCPNTTFARGQTWCVDVDEKTTTYAPVISRTFTGILNASTELSGLPIGATLYWRIGARNSTDDPGVFPAGYPAAQVSGAKHTRWIYIHGPNYGLRIASNPPPLPCCGQ